MTKPVFPPMPGALTTEAALGLDAWLDKPGAFFGLDRTAEPYRFSEEYGRELAARPWLEQQADMQRTFAEGAAVAFGIIGMFEAIRKRSGDGCGCPDCYRMHP